MGSMTGSPGVRLRARETNTMQHMYHTTSRIKVLDILTLENRSKTTHTRHRRDPTLSQAKYTDIPTINGTNTNQRSPSIPSPGAWLFFPLIAHTTQRSLRLLILQTSPLPQRRHNPRRHRLIRPAPTRLQLDDLGVDAPVYVDAIVERALPRNALQLIGFVVYSMCRRWVAKLPSPFCDPLLWDLHCNGRPRFKGRCSP